MTEKVKTSPEFDRKFLELVKQLDRCSEIEDCDMCRMNTPERYESCIKVFGLVCSAPTNNGIYRLPEKIYKKAITGLQKAGCQI